MGMNVAAGVSLKAAVESESQAAALFPAPLERKTLLGPNAAFLYPYQITHSKEKAVGGEPHSGYILEESKFLLSGGGRRCKKQ